MYDMIHFTPCKSCDTARDALYNRTSLGLRSVAAAAAATVAAAVAVAVAVAVALAMAMAAAEIEAYL